MSVYVMLAVLCLGSANDKNDSWYDGKIVMTNGEIVRSRFAIVHDHEALLIKKVKGQLVIPAHKIMSFDFYDPEEGHQRNYRVFTQKVKGYNCHKFYEVVKWGKVPILRKTTTNARYRGNTPYSVSRVWSKNLQSEWVAQDYYAYIDGRMISLDKFRRKILPVLIKSEPLALKNLILEEKLNFDTLGHRVVLIVHYNLIQEDGSVASLE